MSDNEDLIKQFTDVTGVPEERARFYLESANFELQMALSSFYEADAEEMPVDEAATPTKEESDDDEVIPSPIPKFAKSESKSKAKKDPSSNFATLDSIQDSSSDDEEERGQAFYAGGSERSGQQVLGPPKKNPIKEYVSEIFRSAQQGNLETFDPADTSSSSRSHLYGGTGYRLGETDSDHVVIPSPSTRTSTNANHEVVTLTLWRQGFSVNDGDLRRYDDASNKEFFECIMRGQIPEELRVKGPSMIHLDIKDNRHEDFVKTAQRFRAFAGEGHTLGSPAPAVVERVAASAAPSTAVASSTNADNEIIASSELNTDESQPTTMLQIRLADGSRLSSRFNQSHTIENVRRYIMAARPQYSSQEFTLLTTFPSKELTDESQTLKDAGLLNAAILQRMK